jgi:hypothetical protein
MVATFAVHVGENFTHDQLRSLVEWIGTMPTTKGTSLELDGIRRTSSTLFIFETARVSFMRLDGLPGAWEEDLRLCKLLSWLR